MTTEPEPGTRPPGELDHPWAVAPERAREIQLRLREQVRLEPPSDFEPRLVAGADLSIGRGETAGHAAVVVLDASDLSTVAAATARVGVDFPYVPGLLSFRELPALEAAWGQLEVRPDVVIFDGHGLAHPRRFGLACHGGLRLGVPAVGCAKSVLVGEHEALDPERGSRTALVHEGGTVGSALRTRDGVRPAFVSPGHRCDLATAVEVVLSVSPRYRIPEPIRRADRLVGRLRREAGER